MRVWHIVLLASALIGVFGLLIFWVANLEQRVETLYAVVHSSTDEVGEEGGTTPAASGQGVSPQRFRELEGKVEKLQADLSGLSLGQKLAQGGSQKKGSSSSSLGDAVKSSKLDEYILSVVRDEATRMRDETVDTYRDVWAQQRMEAIRQFAQQQGLSADQEAGVQRSLEDEVYKIVEAVRTPEQIKDPQQAVASLLQTFKETDEQVEKLLNKQQMAVYLYLRHLERQTLMPWLPK